jgi:hypothetical protein
MTLGGRSQGKLRAHKARLRSTSPPFSSRISRARYRNSRWKRTSFPKIVECSIHPSAPTEVDLWRSHARARPISRCQPFKLEEGANEREVSRAIFGRFQRVRLTVSPLASSLAEVSLGLSAPGSSFSSCGLRRISDDSIPWEDESAMTWCEFPAWRASPLERLSPAIGSSE